MVAWTELEPLGVTAHIVPWNFPLTMLLRGVASTCCCMALLHQLLLQYTLLGMYRLVRRLLTKSV